MDPNEALTDIRNGIENFYNNGIDVDLEHIFDRIDALDSWISNGGFLPEDWSK